MARLNSWLTPVGRPYRAADGEWTQQYRVHPWRPSFWRYTWQCGGGSPISRVMLILRAIWRYR